MKRVHEVIVVEGRYDKNAVSQVVDAMIVETSGFSVFTDKQKVKLLRKLAETRGLIILTDSDSAGFLIRGRLHGILGGANLKHAYIPDVTGREKRKAAPSREGKLGVEGTRPDKIIAALERAGATFDDETPRPLYKTPITKADMYEAGLSGSPGSASARRELLRSLDLPEKMSANSLLDVLNTLYSREDFLHLLQHSYTTPR